MRTLNFKIDLYGSPPKLMLKQGDDTELIIDIFARGLAFDLTGYSVILNAVHENNLAAIQTTGITSSGNVLTVYLDQHIVAASGNTQLELMFIKNNTRVSSYVFYAELAKTLISDNTAEGDTVINAIYTVINTPYISNNYWYVWDNENQEFVNSGVSAGGAGSSATWRHTFTENDWSAYSNKWQLLIPTSAHPLGSGVGSCAIEKLHEDVYENVQVSVARTVDGTLRLRANERFAGKIYLI